MNFKHLFNKEIILKLLKTTLLLSLVLTSFTSQANDIATLKKSLKPWQPIEVSKSGDTLTVVLNENQITPTVYDAIISAGACMAMNEYVAPPQSSCHGRPLSLR